VKNSYINKCVFYTFQGSNVLTDLKLLGEHITQYAITDTFDYDSIDITKSNFLIFNWSRYLPDCYDESETQSEYQKQGFIFTKKFFDIVHILSQKNFIFLIDNVMEADVYITPEMIFFLEKFKVMKIPETRLAMIYNNSNNMAKSVVKIRDFNLNTLHFPHFFISTLFELPDPQNRNFEKEKDFLILNRRLGFNKFKLLKEVLDRGLLDKSIYTILTTLSDTDYKLSKDFELVEAANAIGMNKLPIRLKNDIAIPYEIINGDAYLYKLNTDVFFKTKVNIVTETFLDYTSDERFDDTIHITEKTWKPIYLGVPFVISATNGHLKTLHKFGFKTFEGIIDESYDSEEDVNIKLSKIVTSAIELAKKWNTEEVLNVLKYNRNLFMNLEHKRQIVENYFIRDFRNMFSIITTAKKFI
jgi:hypothetical protein